jgi:HSP20 family protein
MTASSDHIHRIQIYRRDALPRNALYFRRHEIHTLFEELIHKPWGAVRWNPPVDVREDPEAFIIEMDLPGVKAEEVRVVADGKNLTIEGQRKLGVCNEATSHVCERQEGRFARTFEFDDIIEGREIESHWQDGVLKVTIPKPRKEGDGYHGS